MIAGAATNTTTNACTTSTNSKGMLVCWFTKVDPALNVPNKSAETITPNGWCAAKAETGMP